MAANQDLFGGMQTYSPLRQDDDGEGETVKVGNLLDFGGSGSSFQGAQGASMDPFGGIT